MVDFELTDEQRLMQKPAHEFAEREMRPLALEYDRKGTVPWEIIRKAHALGLDTAFIPEAYGGGGVDSTLTHVVVTEELNWGCAGMATGLIGAGLAYLPIIHVGTDDQKKRFLTLHRTRGAAGGPLPHGTRCRIRRREHLDDRDEGREAMGPERGEAFHHERGDRGPACGLRHGRQEPRVLRNSRVRRRARHPGPPGGKGRG